MKHFLFESLYQGGLWHNNVLIQTDQNGVILSVTKPGEKKGQEKAAFIEGAFLPGFPNAHSHSFQYAMAGLAEYLAPGAQSDDFWSWRESMYRLALKVDPDSLAQISTCLYAEMLTQGICRVVEFHYLHHDKNGAEYEKQTAMCEALMEGAKIAGIQLTLVPVFYQNGDFSKQAATNQKRFLFQSVEKYFHFLAQLEAKKDPFTILGRGVHSLRAASRPQVIEILDPKTASGPLHIHIAEQQKEVEACLTHWGQRPVKWLFDHIPMSSRHNLVHATHLDKEELLLLAKSSARVVLCPSTEGNLGDGSFPLKEFLEARGDFAIGSDSHVGLSFAEELRWLDYQVRLLKQKRNVVCSEESQESGEVLFQNALKNGLLAAGQQEAGLVVGGYLDGFCLETKHPMLYKRPKEKWISSMIYTHQPGAIKDVYVRGERVVENGRHKKEDVIRKGYQKAIDRLSFF